LVIHTTFTIQDQKESSQLLAGNIVKYEPVTKKTKIIRMKPLTAEEDWYKTYHWDIEEIPNDPDLSEELAEELLGWSSQKSINAPHIS
jgi:hypothetical protein